MERLLWTLGMLAICALLVLAAVRGWRARARRQAGLVAPARRPDDPGADLVPPLPGVYVSTTTAGSWQDRIVAHGLGRRARAEVRLLAAGVLIERQGEPELFLPVADIIAVATAPGIAGKVMGVPDGLLLITWSLGGTPVDTGVRADDPQAQAAWLDAARSALGTRATDTADPPAAAGGPAPRPDEHPIPGAS